MKITVNRLSAFLRYSRWRIEPKHDEFLRFYSLDRSAYYNWEKKDLNVSLLTSSHSEQKYMIFLSRWASDSFINKIYVIQIFLHRIISSCYHLIMAIWFRIYIVYGWPIVVLIIRNSVATELFSTKAWSLLKGCFSN